jgi:hypothetical protein
LDEHGLEFSPETPLHGALTRAGQLSLRVHWNHTTFEAPGSDAGANLAAAPADSRFHEGPGSAATREMSSDERYDHFLREFLRLQQRHEFMWAGYIVRELLPRLGFPPEEAKVVLDRLRAENLVTITRVPNPKNPSFPATGVLLNLEHPRIKALLGSDAGTEPAFEPSTVAPVPADPT